MRKINGIIWGVVLIVLGCVFALNTFGVTDINIFFDGWWTLFIIVPCLVGIFSSHEKFGNVIGLIIGVFLLLCCQDLLSFDMLWKLSIPAIIIIIGVKMIIRSIFNDKTSKLSGGPNHKNEAATFSNNNINYDGEVFEGAEFNAIFGGIKCDLTRAIITNDCAINATAIFGGIDIILPPNVNIKVKSNSIFGGISDKSHRNLAENTVTIYIEGTCMFGGVDIK